MYIYLVIMSPSVFLVDPSPGQEERGSATLPKHQPFPTTSKRFSPVHFERLEPTQREADDMVRD